MLPLLGIVVALALVLGGVWVATSPAPAPPAAVEGPNLENDELVLATLEPSGLPTDAVLVSTVTARGGPPRVVDDPASTVNVTYLNRRGSPQIGAGVVHVQVGGDGATTAVTEATFDKPLPVALHAEYRIDGEVVAPTDVLGAAGDMTVTYTVTNTTAEQTEVRYTDGSGEQRSAQVPVFIPFAGTLDVLLPRGQDVVEAVGAVRSADAQGRTLLRYPVLLAPPIGDVQATAVVRVRTSDAATPLTTLDVVPETSETDPATGFSASALVGAVEGNTELAEGLGELGEKTTVLAEGAEVVANGSDDLASGTAVLADQVGGALLAGSEALDRGAAALVDGTGQLATGLAAVGSGADEVALGLVGLSSGLDELAAGLRGLAADDGLPRAAAAASGLTTAAEQIADGVGSSDDGAWPPPALVADRLPDLPDVDLDTLDPASLGDLTVEELAALVSSLVPDPDTVDAWGADVPAPTLVQSVRLLERATRLLALVSVALVDSVHEQSSALADAGTSSAAAAAGAAALSTQVCGPAPTLTPEQCATLGAVAEQSRAATAATARAAKAAAVQKTLAAGLAAGLTGLDAALGLVEDAVLDLSTALRSGDVDDPGLVEGLDLLEQGLAETLSAVDLLLAGADAAGEGSDALAAGADALSAALDDAADGAGALAQGVGDLAFGTSEQADGVAALASGADGLAAGARAAATGSAQVADGLQELGDEGIDAVEQAVRDAVDEPALAAAWLDATDRRAADALPYGPPDDAVGHAAYRLTMPATYPDESPTWPWWLLGVATLAAAVVIARRRLAAAALAP